MKVWVVQFDPIKQHCVNIDTVPIAGLPGTTLNVSYVNLLSSTAHFE